MGAAGGGVGAAEHMSAARAAWAALGTRWLGRTCGGDKAWTAAEAQAGALSWRQRRNGWRHGARGTGAAVCPGGSGKKGAGPRREEGGGWARVRRGRGEAGARFGWPKEEMGLSPKKRRGTN